MARSQLQHLPEQNEHRDHGRSLEVDADLPMLAEGRRKNPGPEHRDRAVEIGHAHAHRDEGKHVEMPRTERTPAALEKRSARPEHRRRAEQKLNPARGVARHPGRRPRHEMRHGEEENRQRRARPRSRTAASCPSARCCLPARHQLPSARAPCRRLGNRPDDPARSPDASGRCRSHPGQPAGAPHVAALRETSPDLRRTFACNRASKSNRSRPRACSYRRPSPDRPSFRKPDRCVSSRVR